MMSLFDNEQIMKTYWKDMENTLTDKITQQITRKVTQKVTQQVTQKVTQQVTQKVTQQVTQKVTQQVTQQVTQKVTQQVTQKVTHDKDRETAERLIKKGKMSLEDIADCVPALSFDELKEIETEIMQLA